MGVAVLVDCLLTGWGRLVIGKTRLYRSIGRATDQISLDTTITALSAEPGPQRP
jgi:hypothetical protein